MDTYRKRQMFASASLKAKHEDVPHVARGYSRAVMRLDAQRAYDDYVLRMRGTADTDALIRAMSPEYRKGWMDAMTQTNAPEAQ